MSVNLKSTDYILPFIKLNRKKVSAEEFRDHIESINAQMNGHLYEIAEKLQIPRFSMHTGRHTFANNAIHPSFKRQHSCSIGCHGP